MLKKFIQINLLTVSLFMLPAYASGGEEDSSALEEAMTPTIEVGYYNITPDITTNLAQAVPSKKLNYIRLKSAIMVSDSRDVALLKEKNPIIRDALISILGSKTYGDISKPSSREALRVECRKKLSEIFFEYEGREVVSDFLILNYLYQ